MSQKTNPLSLRLQKSNQNFSSPWFSDFFWGESFHYQFEIENYISKLLRDTQHSKAFFSVENLYRKSNIFLVLQDSRAQRKQKLLSFNLKENISSSKSSTLSFLQKIYSGKANQFSNLKIQEQINENYINSLPNLFSNKESKEALEKRFAIGSDSIKRASEIENFHKYLSSFPSAKKKKTQGFVAEGKTQRKKTDFLFSFREKVRNDFLKSKQNYNVAFLPSYQRYLLFFCFPLRCRRQEETPFTLPLTLPFTLPFTSGNAKGNAKDNTKGKENYSFQKNVNTLKDLWEVTWKNKVARNNLFSFPEKIIAELPLSFQVKYSIPLSLKDGVSKKQGFYHIEGSAEGKVLSKKEISLGNTFLVLSEKQKNDLKVRRGGCNLRSLFPITTNFEPIRFISDTQNVMALLDTVVALIEKRVSFREIKSKLFQNLSKDPQIKGVRISCSGRLGGRSKKAQKAKMQSDQWGETSLHAFSSKVLFANKSAYTPYGKVGIKIWLSFNDF